MLRQRSVLLTMNLISTIKQVTLKLFVNELCDKGLLVPEKNISEIVYRFSFIKNYFVSKQKSYFNICSKGDLCQY